MRALIITVNSDWIVKLLAIGRGTSVVRETYQTKMHELQEFFPDAVLMHLGHDDLVHHPRHNPTPLSSSLAFTQAMRFMDEVSEDMPFA